MRATSRPRRITQIDLLKARLAKLEKSADRLASFVDDHIAGLV
jgi:hypothetical protein